MERDELAKVFYGTGPVPAVWATDCPVRFDVWLAFAQPAASKNAPPARVDIILEINEEHGTRRVLDHFVELNLRDCAPIASGSFISARLTLEEMITAVLPMTSLAGAVMEAQQAGLKGSREALQGSYQVSSVEVQASVRDNEETRRLVWLLELLRSVITAARPPTPRKRTAKPAAGSKPRRPAQPNALNEAHALLARANPSKTVRLPDNTENPDEIDRRRRYPVLSVTTNRPVRPAVSRSRSTVKADAAEQLFSVDCSTIGWAIVDSGIDAAHPAFCDWRDQPGMPLPTQGPGRVIRAFDFVGRRDTLAADASNNGLVDWSQALPYLEMSLLGQPGAAPQQPQSSTRFMPMAPYLPPGDPHGTHIAGIIGGYWPARRLRGICPNIRLYDFRVLDAEGKGDEFAIVTALQAIRYINEQAGRMVIAGANVSLSVPHDVAAHSCGWTPVCIECDRLTRSGVIVVAAAGNGGYTGVMKTSGVDYHTVSISDPGNTDAVITVGSTHRTDPHRHGVSYFSSRGPTADGRAKPDLLAPGEDIDGPVPSQGIAAMHGTSQAAAHVSGAAAMLVARYRELLGRPERVKSILCATATDLGRERDFQGSGLVDVLRAMQSI